MQWDSAYRENAHHATQEAIAYKLDAQSRDLAARRDHHRGGIGPRMEATAAGGGGRCGRTAFLLGLITSLSRLGDTDTLLSLFLLLGAHPLALLQGAWVNRHGGGRGSPGHARRAFSQVHHSGAHLVQQAAVQHAQTSVAVFLEGKRIIWKLFPFQSVVETAQYSSTVEWS